MRLHCPKCGKNYEFPDLQPAGEDYCHACFTLLVPMPTPNPDAVRDGRQAPPVAAAAAAAEQDTPGKSFGRYRLLAELGRGGMGVVWKAWDSQLKRVVALKQLLAAERAAPADAPQSERFMREARLAAKLRHPNIVAVHDVGIYQGQNYFTADYIAGQSLDKLIKQKPVPTRQAIGWVKTVAEALAYAHSEGVVHRDVKPANVIIDGHGRPYVMDFGLAKEVEMGTKGGKKKASLTVSGTLLGTPHYMSPEQAGGKRLSEVGAIAAATDQFSLGSVLYELLTGRQPFTGDSLRELLNAVSEKDPIPPSKLNARLHRDLETICLKALEKEPERRYASMAELAEDLGRYLEGEPIRASPISTASRLWKKVKRNRAAFAAGALALAIAATAVAVFAIGAARRSRDIEKARASMQAAFARKDWNRAKEDAVGLLSLCPDDADAARIRDECHKMLDERVLRAEAEKRRAETEKSEQKERARLQAKAWEYVDAGRGPIGIAKAYLYVPGTQGLEKTREKLKESIKAFEKARETAPELAVSYYYVGRAHHIMADRVEARKWYEEALKRESENAVVLMWLGRLKTEEAFSMLGGGSIGDREQRWRMAQEVAEDGVRDLEKGLKFWKEGEQAGKGWETADMDVVMARAMVALAQRRYDEVIRVCNEASERYAGEFGREEFSWLRGVVCYWKDELDGAIGEFDSALAVCPHYAEAYFFRGIVRMAKRDSAGAISDWDAAIRINPRYAEAYCSRGATRFGKNDYDGAIADYDAAITINPSYANAHNNRGVARRAKGDFDGAISDYDTAITTNPRYAEAYANRGNARYEKGDTAGAVADYEKALEVSPSTWPIRKTVEQWLTEARKKLQK